jgi:hypothetical protein
MQAEKAVQRYLRQPGKCRPQLTRGDPAFDWLVNIHLHGLYQGKRKKPAG